MYEVPFVFNEQWKILIPCMNTLLCGTIYFPIINLLTVLRINA